MRAQPARAVVARVARRVGLRREAERRALLRRQHVERVGEDHFGLAARVHARRVDLDPARRGEALQHARRHGRVDHPRGLIPAKGHCAQHRLRRERRACVVFRRQCRLVQLLCRRHRRSRRGRLGVPRAIHLEQDRPSTTATAAHRLAAAALPEQRAHARRRERRLDRRAVLRAHVLDAVGLAQPREVGPRHRRREVGQRPADLAVRAVVPADEQQRQPLLGGDRQLLHAHLQPAIADEQRDRPAAAVEPPAEACADGGGQTVAERRRAHRVEEGGGPVRGVHRQRRVAEAADVAHERRVVGQRRAQAGERL
mmetsp:Transcript_41628/g.138421  ORF Transcript_41628/g.138421 Transcript_41628/m.138421 type:complete len:312 (-) Transcript_41628:258-1193(-)